MPLIVPKNSPCAQRLRSEGIPMLESIPSGVCPLRILLLNLMPLKEDAEMEYYRMLAYSGLYIQIILVKMSGLEYKNTPQVYMNRFYTDFKDIQNEYYDGMIITGAPLEHLLFEEVKYWEQLKEIFCWTKRHIRSTLFVCWGAQAALYALYRIPKFWLHHKVFGVYEQKVIHPELPIFEGFDSRFYMPQSRHTEVRIEDMQYVKELQLLASSPISGAGIISAFSGREFFVTGHLEYHRDRLAYEYTRDIKKGLAIKPPCNYYENDDPAQPVLISWRSGSILFYTNWLRHYVNDPSLDKIPFQ